MNYPPVNYFKKINGEPKKSCERTGEFLRASLHLQIKKGGQFTDQLKELRQFKSHAQFCSRSVWEYSLLSIIMKLENSSRPSEKGISTDQLRDMGIRTEPTGPHSENSMATRGP